MSAIEFVRRLVRGERQPEPSASLEIFNFFHCTANNVGDLMCGPGQYLWPANNRSVPVQPTRRKVDCAVLGGGQIFGQLSEVLFSILDRNPEAKAVAWGVGLPPKGRKDADVMEVAEGFKLFGTRNYDWREQLSFVPCASCLSPAFDRAPPAQHDVVFFLHQNKGDPIEVPEYAPCMLNTATDMQTAINHIAAGEIVVTSSFHGVYWAQLLGRKVICVPYNDKFKAYQHAPIFAKASEWQDALKKAAKAPDMLEEYREINRNFAKKAMEVWNG